jgi:hypothetical protein
MGLQPRNRKGHFIQAQLAEVTRAAVAIAVTICQRVDDCVSGRIHYCRMSEAIKDLKGMQWIKKGASAPTTAGTARFNAYPAKIAGAPKPPRAIFGSGSARRQRA